MGIIQHVGDTLKRSMYGEKLGPSCYVDRLDEVDPAWIALLPGSAMNADAGGVRGGAIAATGINLIATNANLSSWSGDDPVGWTVIGELAPNYLVTEVAGPAARVWTSDGTLIYFYQYLPNALTPYATYAYSVNVTSWVSGSGAFVMVGVDAFGLFNSAGLKTGTKQLVSGTSAAIGIQRNTPGVANDFAVNDLDLQLEIAPFIRPQLSANGVLTVSIKQPGSADIPSASRCAPVSILVRASDINNWWEVRVHPNTTGQDLFLIERNAGAEDVRITADVDWTNGGTDELAIDMQGDTIALLTRKQGETDWTFRGSWDRATHNQYVAQHGLMFYYAGVTTARILNWAFCRNQEATWSNELLALFGAATDIHYADMAAAPPAYYRDSDDKLTDAVAEWDRMGCNFVIEMGDFIQGARGVVDDTADLVAIDVVFSSAAAPHYHVFGNHEVYSLSKAQVMAVTGEASSYYSFDAAGVHVVVLDDSFYADDDTKSKGDGSGYSDLNSYIPPNERAWLAADLAATSLPVVVFNHCWLHADTPGGTYVLNATAVRAILEASGKVRAVFCGHGHASRLTISNNICYHCLDAMITNAYPDTSYAVIGIYQYQVSIIGYGRQTSY